MSTGLETDHAEYATLIVTNQGFFYASDTRGCASELEYTVDITGLVDVELMFFNSLLCEALSYDRTSIVSTVLFLYTAITCKL